MIEEGCDAYPENEGALNTHGAAAGNHNKVKDSCMTTSRIDLDEELVEVGANDEVGAADEDQDAITHDMNQR